MSSLFTTFLEFLPKNRSEMVSELELPDDLTVSPYLLEDDDDMATLTSDSLISDIVTEEDKISKSSDSSLALSRAMTDSDIDYERFHRLRSRSLSDPWAPIRKANARFPFGYLSSLESFMDTSCSVDTSLPCISPLRPVYMRNRSDNEALRQKMEKFFLEECRVFSPDDPALEDLQDALLSLEMGIDDARLNIGSI